MKVPWRKATRVASERGQALLLAAILAPTLLIIAGFAIDVGRLFVRRADAQKAADSAALAAAYEILRGMDSWDVLAAGHGHATLNGYTTGESGATVEVFYPPEMGDYAGDPRFVEVRIQKEFPALLLSPLSEILSTKVRSVAGVGPSDAEYAILVLNETICAAFEQSGGSSLTITGGGGIMVNSSCDEAVYKSGTGFIDVEPGPVDYYYEGGVKIVGSGDVNPYPTRRSTRIDDPLADRTPPVPGTPAPGSVGTPEDPQVTEIVGSSDKTIYPGTYYGGLKLAMSGNVTMEPGVYIMAGGGFEYSGSGKVTGEEVVIYNTNDPVHPTGAGDYGPIKISGSDDFDLSAPTSGPYEDMLFWQDPDNTQMMSRTGSGYIGDGIIYLPSAELHLGGSGYLGGLQIVVDMFTRKGSGNVTVDFVSYADLKAPRIFLVE